MNLEFNSLDTINNILDAIESRNPNFDSVEWDVVHPVYRWYKDIVHEVDERYLKVAEYRFMQPLYSTVVNSLYKNISREDFIQKAMDIIQRFKIYIESLE